MKKILYISFLNEDIREGYRKKIHSQALSFNVIGMKSYLFIESSSGFRLYRFENGKEKVLKDIVARCETKERKLLSELGQFVKFSGYVRKLVNKIKPQYVYIRRIVPITPALISLLRSMKDNGVIIIYEYPTYPWKDEMREFARRSLIRKTFYCLDNMFFQKLERAVDYITYVGQYEGKNSKYICINNCGNANDFRIIHANDTKTDSIRMIAVAHISYIHGYDLMIRALGEYYKKEHDREVYFDVVGPNDFQKEYEDLIKQYEISKHVKLYGYTIGEELDRLMDKANIGVNVLRFEDMPKKRGATTLKTVEYTFRGMPQICSAPLRINVHGADYPEFIYVTPDPEHISIEDIIHFFDGLSMSTEEIREYAVEHLSWNNLYKEVFKEIETGGSR